MMSDEDKRLLERNRANLVEVIDLDDSSLLAELLSCKALTDQQKRDIMSERLESDRVDMMLTILQRTGSDDTMDKFKSSLRASGHSSVADSYLRQPVHSKDHEAMDFMSDAHAQIINGNFEQISTLLNPTSVVPRLVSDGVFTIDEMDAIEKENATRQQQAKALLLLLGRKRDHAFYSLMHACEANGMPDVAKILRDADAELPQRPGSSFLQSSDSESSAKPTESHTGDDPIFSSEERERLRAKLVRGKRKVGRARIMLVGPYGAGKTSVMRTLLGQEFELKWKSTVGVETENLVKVGHCVRWEKVERENPEKALRRALNVNVNASNQDAHQSEADAQTEIKINPVIDKFVEGQKQVESEDTNNDGGIFNIWDFAGQNVYYTSHQTFLCDRAIYVLVTDISKNLKDAMSVESSESQYKMWEEKWKGKGAPSNVKESLEFWMNSIHTRLIELNPKEGRVTDETDDREVDMNGKKDETREETERKEVTKRDCPPVIIVCTKTDLLPSDKFIMKNILNTILPHLTSEEEKEYMELFEKQKIRPETALADDDWGQIGLPIGIREQLKPVWNKRRQECLEEERKATLREQEVKGRIEEITGLMKGKVYFKHVRDPIFAVSNCTDNCKGVTDLKEKLWEEAQPFWNEERDNMWLLLMVELEKEKNPVMPLSGHDGVLDKASGIGMDEEEDVLECLRYHHRLGDLLFFEGEGLGTTVIRPPQWLADKLKQFINHEFLDEDDEDEDEGEGESEAKKMQVDEDVKKKKVPTATLR